jgi:hypothetical protein
MKKIKHVLGANAHWTINKQLVKDVGLHETLLLQHLIDLQESFFEDGGFYQQDHRLLEDLRLSEFYLKKARTTLKNKGLITVKSKGLPARNHYTVNVDAVLESIGLKYLDKDPASQSLGDSLVSNPNLGNTNNKDKTNNKNTKSGDELLLDKVIEKYPGNVGSKTPILKALKQLSTEEKKLALKNLDRYSKAWVGFHHNLRNYIEGKQFMDTELKKRETKSTSKKDTTHNFTQEY